MALKPINIEVRDSTIHGRGLFATVAILKEDIIFTESPSMFHTVDAGQFTEASVAGAISYLPSTELAAFYNLHCDPEASESEKTLAKIISNAFELTAPKGYVTLGLFMAAARFNHSPTPNATLSWNDEKEQIIIEALQDVPKGNEVTIAYCCTQRSKGMFEFFKSKMAFTCNCGICAKEKLPAESSNGEEDSDDSKKGACLCNTCSLDATNAVSDEPAKILSEGMSSMVIRENNDPHPGESYCDDDYYSDDYYDDDGVNEDDLGQLDIRPGVHSWLE